MVRVRVVLLLSLALVAGGLVEAVAEDGGLSGTVGAEAAFLPGFSSELWLDLDWQVDGWSFGALTEVLALPAFGVSWTGSVGYTLGPVDLGGTMMIDVYPFGFVGLDLSAGVGLLDVSQDGFAVSADASLLAEILPAFGSTLSLDVDASYGIFSLWVDFDLGVPGFGVDLLVGGEVRVLDLDLEEGSLTADLGASTFVLPGPDAQLWFDVKLALGGIVVKSETDFALTPFGLMEQRFEIEVGSGGITVYAWGSFTGAGDLSAGIGGTYDFP